MMTVHKFPLVVEVDQRIEMPRNATILSVQVQRMVPCIWAWVDDGEPMVKRDFRIFGTGHDTGEENMAYHGTFQMGDFVWHLFEVEA